MSLVSDHFSEMYHEAVNDVLYMETCIPMSSHAQPREWFGNGPSFGFYASRNVHNTKA